MVILERVWYMVFPVVCKRECESLVPDADSFVVHRDSDDRGVAQLVVLVVRRIATKRENVLEIIGQA